MANRSTCFAKQRDGAAFKAEAARCCAAEDFGYRRARARADDLGEAKAVDRGAFVGAERLAGVRLAQRSISCRCALSFNAKEIDPDLPTDIE